MSSACRGSNAAIPPVWWWCHWKAGRARARPHSLTLPESVASLTMGGFAPLEASPRRVAGVSWLYWCNSPCLVAVRSRFGAAWRPKCRPPRRKTLTTGGHGRGGLRFGHNGAWPRLELAREPLNMRGNPFFNPESPPLLPCTGSETNEKPRARKGSGRLLLRLDSNQ